MKNSGFRSAVVLLIIPLLYLQGCSSSPLPTTDPGRLIDSTLSSDFFNQCQGSVSVYDLTSGRPLYAKNDKLLFHPASNQKILTTAAALLYLGLDYKFKTCLFREGSLADSTFIGNFYFTGGFDPLFSSTDLDSAVAQIGKSGIKHIDGNLYADFSTMDSLKWGEGWMWDDEMAFFSPLSINDNEVKVVVSPGEMGKHAKFGLIPQTRYVQIQNQTETVETGSSTLTVERDWPDQKNIITIAGKILLTAKPDTIPISIFDPDAYFITLVKESLCRHGISITGKIDSALLPSGASQFLTINHGLEPAINRTNKISHNLSAELILRTLALEKYGKPASARNGISLIDTLIAGLGLDPAKYRLADGSGVSFYNLVSSELIVEVFKYLYYNKPSLFLKLFDSFPVSGVDGTLSRRMMKSPALGQVHAKTGSLKGVSAISGFIRSRKNHNIAFSIMMQNFPGNHDEARNIQDRICEIIYQQY
jgi:serine-type D-Ala-D-Ala carboxypeptidase/endopeptidase (penicillin-binding protein 4)